LYVAQMQVYATDGEGGGTLVNWASTELGATAVASSIHYSEQLHGSPEPVKNTMELYAAAEHAIDGSRLGSGTDWRTFARQCWIAGEPNKFPQWLEIQFDTARQVQSVLVYHIAWARWSPKDDGIRDFEIHAHVDGQWKTLHTVKNNTDVVSMIRIPEPVKTDRLRVWITATNDPDGYVGLSAVEAFGPQ